MSDSPGICEHCGGLVGADGMAEGGEVGDSTASKTATETATRTETNADTRGNITVTGGAGRGATTSVTIRNADGFAKAVKERR